MYEQGTTKRRARYDRKEEDASKGGAMYDGGTIGEVQGRSERAAR